MVVPDGEATARRKERVIDLLEVNMIEINSNC